MRAFWLKLIGGIAAGIAFLLVVLISLSLWAFYYPQQAWSLVRPLVIPRDIQVAWSESSFKPQKISLRVWRFEWQAKGLSFNRQSPKLAFKADVKAAGEIRLFDPRTEVKLDSLEIVSTEPGFFESSEGVKPANPPNPHQQVETYKKYLGWANRFVSADKLNVKIADLSVSGQHLQLGVTKPGVKDPQAVDALIGLKTPEMEGSVAAAIRLDQVFSGASFLRGALQAKNKAGAIDGTFELQLPEGQAKLLVTGKGQKGAMKATVNAETVITSTQMTIKGKSDADHLPGGIPDLKGIEWSVNLPLWDGVVMSTLAGEMHVNAPVPLALITADMRKQLEQNCRCKWPDALRIDLDGKLWIAHLFATAMEDRPIATLAFKVEPLNNPLAQLNTVGEIRITRDKNQEFHFSPTIDANVKFPNFQALKGFLESYKIVIPSPFDVLQGSIEGHVKTTLWQSDKGLVVPIEGKANLATTEQKVNLETKITLFVPEGFKSMDVVMDFTVHDFVVELPPVDPVQGIPQLTKDSRLQLDPEGPTPAADAFKFRLMYGVRTSKPGAVRLLSKLAKPAIPVSLDLDRTAKGDVLGTVKVEPFELNYLHRTMFIDQLRVILDDRETADFAVDGRLRMEQTSYKIGIAISGSLRSPLIKLSSEPELSRSDIISVLLYDRTTDQIAPSDRETVGSFDSAIADRAIGLLGLWVFASTPIRSFSYNPTTKVYTATVQLTGGVTASLGTNWEEAAQLEVRKRVTKRWVLTASWAPSQDKSQEGKLVLQWEKRF